MPADKTLILPHSFSITFWGIAAAASLFYGLKACDAFEVDPGEKPPAWWVHQFWFNLAGSLFGWAALWFLVRKAWLCISTSCPAQLDLSDGFTIFFAFVGITGHLPYAVAGILQGIKELALKVASVGK